MISFPFLPLAILFEESLLRNKSYRRYGKRHSFPLRRPSCQLRPLSGKRLIQVRSFGLRQLREGTKIRLILWLTRCTVLQPPRMTHKMNKSKYCFIMHITLWFIQAMRLKWARIYPYISHQ